MNTINERLYLVYKDSEDLSIRQFAASAGVPCGTLTYTLHRGTEPRSTLLEAILKANPKVSAEWLMRGEGPMYKGEGCVAQESNNSDGNNSRQYDTKTVVDSDATAKAIAALREELRSKNELIKQLASIL